MTNAYDRATHRREDNPWLKSKLLDSESRYLLFFKGRVLASKTSLKWMPPSSDYPNEHSVFLGILNGRAIFAVPLKSPFEDGEAKHRDTRRLGMGLDEMNLAILCQAQSMLHWHHTTQFCSRCSGPLKSPLAGHKKQCDSCNTDIFPRLNPVVIMNISNGQRILLGRQPQFPKNMYSCLAGFIEHGEDLEDAVRREVLEEANISIGKISYQASQAWPFPAQLMLGCQAEALTTDIQIDDELEDARWFSLADIGKMLDFCHPEGYFIPPAIAIAHHLIKDWYTRATDRPNSINHNSNLQ